MSTVTALSAKLLRPSVARRWVPPTAKLLGPIARLAALRQVRVAGRKGAKLARRGARMAEAVRSADRGATMLHVGFSALPIAAGLDKFFDKTVDWSEYLAPQIAERVPDVDVFMKGVGVVEIAAGVLTLVSPRVGGIVVAAWLGGIIGNLLLSRRHYDVAVRDAGLAVGALALSRIAVAEAELHP